MRHVVCALVPTLAYFDPDIRGLPVQGANLAFAGFLKGLTRHLAVERLEVFLPPALMRDQAGLEQASAAMNAGRGRLVFHPVHALPDVFADGAPRIFRVSDPSALPRERYLRDRFALGPTPISCDTNLLGKHDQALYLQNLVAAPPVPYDSIVALSRSTAASLTRQIKGLLPEGDVALPCRIDVVGRSVDIERFKPVATNEKSLIRAQLGWPEKATIALYQGRVVSAGKADLPSLVRAFSQAAGADDVLVIAGHEATRGMLDRIRVVAGDCGILDKVRLQGPVSPGERHLTYQAADLFVMPGDAIHETFGMTVLEAMASGLPVIASDRDGFKDQVREGQEGFLIPTYWVPGLERVEAISPVSALAIDYLLAGQCVVVDRRVLAIRLRELMSSEELRARMGQASRKKALEFSEERIMAQTVELWDEQAELAQSEGVEARRVRIAYATKLGLPTAYLDVFSPNSTGVLDKETPLRLSRFGQDALLGKIKLAFYDEALAIVDSEVLSRLLNHLALRPCDATTMADLAQAATSMPGASDDAAVFCVAMLLKADVLEIAD